MTKQRSRVHCFRGLFAASVLVVLGAGGLGAIIGIPVGVLLCVVAGLIAGVAIGKLTEYYTAKD